MNKRFVCYLDILGFKEIINNNPHAKVVELFKKFYAEFVFSLPHSLKKNKEKENSFKLDFENIKLNSFVISDSILIWTDDDNVETFRDLIITVSRVLNYSFVSGFPLRGAISHEELSYERSQLPTSSQNEFQMLVGKSLVFAYESEKICDLSGCILHESCYNFLTQNVMSLLDRKMYKLSDFLNNFNLLIKYNVPVKRNKVESYYTVNWVNLTIVGILLNQKIENQFSEFNKSIDTPDVNKKIYNTKTYVEFINTNHKQVFIGTKSLE